MIKFREATTEDAKLIETIADPIWREHYTPIIGLEQVEYMLAKFQNEAAVKAQINSGCKYIIVKVDSEDAGYIAVEKRKSNLFLSKFYLNAKFRGKGVAREMLQQVYDIAEELDAENIELTVNKYNPAYQIYLKLGFINIESIVTDIGDGYVMDDYRMIKPVKP